MIFVYYFTRVSRVRADASAWKAVVCEKCSHQYRIFVTTSAAVTASSPYGIGHNTAEVDADRYATELARRQLRHATEPVPCPECGWCQSSMQEAFRTRRFKWWTAAGWGLVFAGVFSYPITLYILQEAAGLPAGRATGEQINFAMKLAFFQVLLGLGTVFVVKFLRSRYDPNAALGLEQRLDLAGKQSMSEEQYRKQFEDRTPSAR